MAGPTSAVTPRHGGVGARRACRAVGVTAVSRRARFGAGGGARGGLSGAPHLRRRIRVADWRQLALEAAERPRDVAPGRACHRGAVIRREAAGGRGERAAGRSEGAHGPRGVAERWGTRRGRACAGGYVLGLTARLQDRTACAALSVCGTRQGVHAGARRVRLRCVCLGAAHIDKVHTRKVVGHPRLVGGQERGGHVRKGRDHAVLVGCP